MTFTIEITGAHRGLLVFGHFVHSASVAAVALCGSTEVPLVHMKEGGAYTTIAWYLPQPPLGTQTITVYWGFVEGSYEPAAVALCLNGVDPNAQYDTPIVATSASTTTPSITAEMDAGDLVIGIVEGDPSSQGANQTEVLQVTTNGSNYGALNIASKTANGAMAWTFGSSAARTMLALAFKPVGTRATPPLPAEEIFKIRLLEAGTNQADLVSAAHADYLANGPSSDGALSIIGEQGDASWYYDATAVHYKIAEYRGETSPWIETAQKSLYVADGVRYAPNSYGVQGWVYFTHGPAIDWLKSGGAHSREIVQGLRDSPVYSQDGDYLGAENDLGRELAYCVFALVWGVRLELSPSRSSRITQCVDWLYDYLDYYATEDWSGTTKQASPFVVGLLARAAIEHYGISGEVRCLPAIELLCDYLWDEAWIARSAGMRYNLNPDCIDEGGLSANGSPVLNNLIGPMYAWAALQLKDSDPTTAREYMRRADLMFAGSASIANQTGGKQFNQQHMWIFDFLRWRREYYSPPPKRNGRIARSI
jgi:hypothetical protein